MCTIASDTLVDTCQTIDMCDMFNMCFQLRKLSNTFGMKEKSKEAEISHGFDWLRYNGFATCTPKAPDKNCHSEVYLKVFTKQTTIHEPIQSILAFGDTL